MHVHHICPRCHLPVAADRLHILPFVCSSCGYLAPLDDSKSRERSDTRFMMGLAALMVGGFIMMASNVEMRWLQTRDLLGFSSMKSLERLVKVCTDLHQPDCVEKALASQGKKDARRLADYAEFLILRLKYKDALQSLKKYVANAKVEPKANAAYAKALAELGQIDEAAKYFERALAVRSPSTEHIQAYVKYLTRAKRFDQALSVILKVRRSQVDAFPVEYRVISAMRSQANDRIMASKR